jgi:hypothetical protein
VPGREVWYHVGVSFCVTIVKAVDPSLYFNLRPSYVSRPIQGSLTGQLFGELKTKFESRAISGGLTLIILPDLDSQCSRKGLPTVLVDLINRWREDMVKQ